MNKKTFPPLFTRDQRNVRVWAVNVEEVTDELGKSFATVLIQHGIFGNALQKRRYHVTEGKNQGKSNATTPFEQACLDIESETKDKRNKGYRTLANLGMKMDGGTLVVGTVNSQYKFGAVVYDNKTVLGLIYCGQMDGHAERVALIEESFPNKEWYRYYCFGLEEQYRQSLATAIGYDRDGNELSETFDISLLVKPMIDKTPVLLTDRNEIIKNIYARLPVTKVDAKGKMKPMILHHARMPEYGFGSTMFKKSKLVRFPCYGQPKKDGVCALIEQEYGLITREGKDRLTPGGEAWNDICPQIVQAVRSLPLKSIPKGVALHGEVFVAGETLQSITTACKKANALSPKLQFHIFDVADLNTRQDKRIEMLKAIEQEIYSLGLYNVLQVVPTTYLADYEAMLAYEDIRLKDGEEGIVLRHIDGKYEPGTRSTNVLKLVRFDSSEVLITAVMPMENEPTHGMFEVIELMESRPDKLEGVDHWILNGTHYIYKKPMRPFKLTPSEFTHQQRIDFLMNAPEYIGKILTITHRGFTDDGIPRIATAKAFK